MAEEVKGKKDSERKIKGTVKEMELKDLQIGVRYRIKFEDCCVSGEMIGIFLGWDKELDGEWNDRLTYHRAKFDFGEIEGWAWRVEAATENM